MAKQLRLDVAQLTDIGRKRPHNEDNMAYVIPKDPLVMTKKGALFIVADGMGGHAAGEVASEIAVDTVSNMYYQDDSEDVTISLLHAIRRANAAIHQRASENLLRTGMGTTCVAAVLRANLAYIANVGDSRAYLVRGTQIKQVSLDHSWVAEQVRAGLLSEDQARTHAQRNVITRSLGTQAEVDIDVFCEELQEGDSLILCTDGLSGQLGDDELMKIVEEFVPQESVYHLVERANESGGPDNITAIVVRVNEVGAEVPNGRHPVAVGGRSEDEDTAAMGMLPGSPLTIPGRNGEGRSPSSPLRIAAEPLISPDSVTAPQPALLKPKQHHSRLFYPSLTVLVLLLMTVISGGVYYYLRVSESQNVAASISFAQGQITLAEGAARTNPTMALISLANAQQKLRDVQKNHQLTAIQSSQVSTLQTQLAQEVKTAIATYNRLSAISALPCAATSITPLTAGGTTTTAQSLASIQDSKNTPVLYALGRDNGLYRLSTTATQYSLVSAYTFPQNPLILNLAGDGKRLIALAEQRPQGSTPANYSLNVFAQPDPSGQLNAPSTVPIDPTLTKNGNTPNFVTAWGSTVYVIFSSKSNSNNALIATYTIDDKGQVKSPPKQMSISISVNIESVVAFPDRLFILFTGGTVESLQVGNPNAAPVSSQVQPAIAAPLPVSSQAFTALMDVPTSNQGATPAVQVPEFLSVQGATQLSAGVVNSVPHLYIVDPSTHRIVDLKVAEPGASAASATATPTAEKTAVFALQQQYVSPSLFAQLKGMAVDPAGTKLYALEQNSASMSTLIAASTDLQTGCS